MVSAPAWVSMCQPSATRAIDPKIVPPAISATIMTAVRATTPGAPLVAVMARRENVLVAEILDGMGMHQAAPSLGGFSQNFRPGASVLLRSLARYGFKLRDRPGVSRFHFMIF